MSSDYLRPGEPPARGSGSNLAAGVKYKVNRKHDLLPDHRCPWRANLRRLAGWGTIVMSQSQHSTLILNVYRLLASIFFAKF
jgi:hypothetical protein